VTPLYHLVARAAWDAAIAAGTYAPDSLAREGFIHLSTAAQWPRTRERFFAGVADLVLLAIDPTDLPIRYEPADGDHFPHLYAALPIAAVLSTTPV
jgi:uncharacterized protein (DUF952 family)